ncbi:MAG: chemotaxis-specific protein-glutamate methyltransferase CheB [Cyanobacteria bacterium P01_H01_bin.74]
MLKALIVDDSITYRAILGSVLQAIPTVSSSASATNGRTALSRLKQEAFDIVLLDIEMPDLDGLETLKLIKQSQPNLPVVMVSGTNRKSTDITIRALEAGALDFVPKPDYGSTNENTEALKAQLSPIFSNIVQNKQSGNSAAYISTGQNRYSQAAPRPVTAAPARKPLQPKLSFTAEVIVIAVSTGGPNALNEFIPKLPATLGVPVLLVQHMPPVFTASLAASLDKKSPLSVKEAEDGEFLLNNTVYIAPGGYHMAVGESSGRQKSIVLNNTDPPENSCKPSADYLFRSVAKYYQGNTLAIVMTGMGQDGTKGVEQLAKVGSCYCITQSAETCVVYGMPRAVDKAGLSDEQVPLYQLADHISQLFNNHSAMRTG